MMGRGNRFVGGHASHTRFTAKSRHRPAKWTAASVESAESVECVEPVLLRLCGACIAHESRLGMNRLHRHCTMPTSFASDT